MYLTWNFLGRKQKISETGLKKSSHIPYQKHDVKIKTDKLNFTKIKSFYSPRNTDRMKKTKNCKGKISAHHLTQDMCPECIKNSQNSNKQKTTQKWANMGAPGWLKVFHSRFQIRS